MKKASYSDFDNHKKAHVDFQASLGGLSSPVANDKVHWAKDWFVPFLNIDGSLGCHIFTYFKLQILTT